jgi:imidazole glycerol-phosphate synthase subunit HisH
MTVQRFPALPQLRVPHMGWNQVAVAAPTHPLVAGLDADARFYFVHSYIMVPAQADDVLLRAEYGIEFAAGIARGNITGVQFHPEKSHRFGKRLLGNFAALAA